MKKSYLKLPFFLSLALLSFSCFRADQSDPMVAIQIQDRNGLTETIQASDKLQVYKAIDFQTPQPYKKVLRVYKMEGKNRAIINTYHPNGAVWQYLELEEMRAFGPYREWHPNGQQKIEAFVIGGTGDISLGAQSDWLFEGSCKVWDEAGHQVAEIPYQKGVMEGTSIYLYPNGQVEKKLPFSKDLLNGVALEFYPSGNKKSKTSYEKGVKQGESFEYYEKGTIKASEKYKEGLLIQGTYYSLQEKALEEVKNGWGFKIFESGSETLFIQVQRGVQEGVVNRFNLEGECLGFYHVKHGQKHGEEIEYFKNSEKDAPSDTPLKKLSLNWYQDAIHGPAKTWYNNGGLRSQREYCKNTLSGSCCAWYKDGSLMFLEEYEEGRLVRGLYYKKGQKDSISTVIHGNGSASLFDEDGIFLRKVIYSKGKPVDPED